MQTKLTLRMDDTVIKKAKHFAQQQGTSVSQLVSEYFTNIENTGGMERLAPATAAMVGVLKGRELKLDLEAHQQILEDQFS